MARGLHQISDSHPQEIADDRKSQSFFSAINRVGLNPIDRHAKCARRNVASVTGASGKKEDEAEVSPAEDLMREHGLLNRILIIYEEGIRRLRAKEEMPPEAFQSAAKLVRTFVEDYHEKLEEEHLFNQFIARKQLVGLVETLKKQHQAGRKLTEAILVDSTPANFIKGPNQNKLISAVESFIHMYRPQEAREDTVLFPSLSKVFSAKELKELGEQFEEKEEKLFGEEGFLKVVDEVAGIEKQLRIDDLNHFTPRDLK